MAQTNFTPISLYYSATASSVPVNTNLTAGELAINTNDGKLFYKDSSGVVQTLASKAAASGTFSQVTIGSTQLGAGNASAFKNRIINGAMVIDQRNAGASVTPATSQYTLDRWYLGITQASKFSIQQNAGSVTPPVGFANYFGATVVSAYSITATDTFTLRQYIEGFNTVDLAWGTANAKTVTLSFQVYSSLTGTFGGSLRNSAGNRSYPFTYTVSSANTWTSISVTIAGDTSGTWLTTNGIGVDVLFSLGTGSTYLGTAGSWAGANYLGATGQVNMVATNASTFYITGVQLEKGSTATSFDYRPYGTELQLCQRYFQYITNGAVSNISYICQVTSSDTSSIFGMIQFQVLMRTSPTLVLTATSFRANMGTVNANSTTAPTIGNASSTTARFDQAGYGGALTADRSGIVRLNTDSGYVALTAEL